MKRILLIILILFTTKSFAQFFDGEPFNFCTLSNVVYNPGVHGSNPNIQNMWVVTKSDEDYTRYEKAFISERFNDDYSNHTIIGDPTVSYNCHGYSFGIYQGTIPCKITWFEELCNDAFVEITNENNLQYGDIAVVRKYSDYTHTSFVVDSEHSSIVINQDTLISKWGDGPLTKHYKYDLVNIGGFDNGVAVYTYYRRVANTQINGADVFNGNGTYTFAPDVEIESCAWNVEPAAMFQQSSGSGTIANLSYKSNLSYLAPKAVLTFTFSYSCDNHYTVKKEIDLTLPTSTLSGIIESDGFVIDDAATVTVTGEIRSNVSAKIIIKPGGKLIVDGATITTDIYETSKWQGIEVWGVDSLHQQAVNGQYLQGHLELKNGATIENAVCAVELWNPLDNHSEGGMIKATDAIFRNNAKAIHALNYTNYIPTTGKEAEYVSSFRNCSFVIDSNYIGDEIFNEHIDLYNVNGLEFYGCSFSVDNTVPQVSSTSHAIKAIDAGFDVNFYCSTPTFTPCPEEDLIRNSFSGFETGIYVINSGQNARRFSVKSSDFTNNVKGIYALNTGHATITNNDFNVGADAECSFGLYLDRVSNFKIEENMFSGDNSYSSDNYGIVVRESESYNDIYLNTFNDLKFGNVALGKNYATRTNVGLTYTCNVNVGNVHDFCIFRENSIVGGIAPHQGSSTMPAGNIFSGTSTHIYNGGDNTISYYYYTRDISQRPATLKLSNVNTVGTSNMNRCQSSFAPGVDILSVDDIVTLENAYNTTLAAYNALLQTNSQSTGTTEDIEAQLSQLKTEYLNTVGEIVKFYLQQEEKDYEELREWLVKSEDIFSDRMVVASFIQEGNYDDAMTYATMLPKIHNLKGEELQDHNDYMKLIDLYIDLHETNRSTNQLTDAELTMVKNIADNGTGASQSMAEVMVSINDLIMLTPRCLTIPSDMTTTQQTRGAEQEFAPVGAEWYYEYKNIGVSGYVLIESVSDTMIDDIVCRKLSKSINAYSYINEDIYKGILGYEYMTQINDSVMIYRNGEFKKLYDFGAEVGDTLIIPGHDYDPALTNGQGVVIDKGTIELDGHTLKYIDLKQSYDWEECPWAFSCYVNYNNSHYNTVRICEKIGNISGYLLPEPYYMADAEEGGALRCYSDNVMSVSFQDKACDYIVSVDEISSQGSINIFPNPANDNIIIELSSDCHTIEIYDSFGRIMMRRQVAETLSHQVVDIDISKYPSGLYLVVVKDDNNRYYKRIVKN